MQADSKKGFLGFLLTSLVNMANDPDNEKFYFPNFLKTVKINGGKTLVPYETSMNLGSLDSMKQEASDQVCNNGWATFNGYPCGQAENAPSINITSIDFYGINNAMIDSYTLYDPVTINEVLKYPVYFDAKLNAYPAEGDLTNLTIGTEENPASFHFDMTCKTCENPPKHKEDLPADGSFYATMNEPYFKLLLLITFNGPSALNLTIEIPETYTLPESSNPINGISLSYGKNGGLKVENVTVGGNLGSYISNLASEFFGSQEAAQQITQSFNAKIAEADVRNSVAKCIETQFNSIIENLK